VEESPRQISGVNERSLDVVVVEDDDDSRVMLTTLLSSCGCVVRTFREAEEAWTSAHERLPDVLVTDLNLGGGDSG
jgi:CheY-like chemotaxis protein